MAEPQIVTASLEGARVVTDGKTCHLQEYDFAVNQWKPKDSAAWPLSRLIAEQWLDGWNSVDSFATISALTDPADHISERRPHPTRSVEHSQKPNFRSRISYG
jgi:hypothetical protein